MIFLNFSRQNWSSSSGTFFIQERIRFRGRWTPFVHMRRRYATYSHVLENFVAAEARQEAEYGLDGTWHSSSCACEDCESIRHWNGLSGIVRFIVETLWLRKVVKGVSEN